MRNPEHGERNPEQPEYNPEKSRPGPEQSCHCPAKACPDSEPSRPDPEYSFPRAGFPGPRSGFPGLRGGVVARLMRSGVRMPLAALIALALGAAFWLTSSRVTSKAVAEEPRHLSPAPLLPPSSYGMSAASRPQQSTATDASSEPSRSSPAFGIPSSSASAAPEAALTDASGQEPRWLSPAPLLPPASALLPEPSAPGASDQSADRPTRKRIEKLIAEQKFEEAAKETARLRDEARLAKNEALWTWSLVEEAELRTALHGYETAVRFLKEEPWPPSPVDRDLLDLFYAQSLVTYSKAYQWEINNRERVEARGPVDLKAWTRDQIFAEAWAALVRVWKDRDRLEDFRAGDYPDFWRPGNYPAGIRDTLRDSAVYLIARLLADTGFWTPRQTNDLFLLDLERLLTASFDPESAAAELESASSHPLDKIAALLSDHENWCRRTGRPEAAIEARLVRIEALHTAFTQDSDRVLIDRILAEFLSSRRRYPWWAMGQALLAGFTRDEDHADSLVRARKIALEAVERYPLSPGGLRCRRLVAGIEAPEYSLEAMSTDAPGRRSIRVSHRNIERLYIRAYPLDLAERIRSSDRSLLPQWQETQAVLAAGTAAAAWKADLPATSDYRDHRTYVDLPSSLRPGIYLLVSSAREDFARKQNRLRAVSVIVSDLVLLERGMSGGGLEVVILSGETGRPVKGASVDLYAYDWTNGHARVASELTDAQGRVSFAGSTRGGPHFLLARSGDNLALNTAYLYFSSRSNPVETSASLIYTDRSIYRPGQKIYWKILAFRGRRDLGKLRPAAGAPASVWLEDPNGQRVAEATSVTNAFGTASGEFVVPAAGRPLGAWRLRSWPVGSSVIRVEEYKRPTFEVKVSDPAKALRLNRPATLTAEARYYFGLPVASGTAVWQVRREPVYPRWWWRETPGSRAETVAGGSAALKDDGTFEVTFTPQADERTAAGAGEGPGVTYRYTLSADVTDEGGETRSATRTFRLGFVSVEAAIAAESGFAVSGAGASTSFTITRADLSGTPKPGRGEWTVRRLVEPPAALLPADQPMPGPPADAEGGGEAGTFETPGDRMRPRWGSAPSVEEILRLWKEAPKTAASGRIEHDANGRAVVTLTGLEPGAYRLVYETKDDFGALCRESRDFLVAGKGAEAPRLPLVLIAEQSTVPVGKTARLLVQSGLKNQSLLLETFKGGELWERRSIGSDGSGAGIIEIPVTEELRGGFGARLTAVRDHQFMSETARVFVPWDSKDLDLSFSSFRDKLTPGGRETWKVSVKTPGGKPAVQGAAELLAYMYDRSLDLFAPHRPPRLGALYPDRTRADAWETDLGLAPTAFAEDSGWTVLPSYPTFTPDELATISGYWIGGPGGRVVVRGVLGGVVGGVEGGVKAERAAVAEAPASDTKKTMVGRGSAEEAEAEGGGPAQEAPVPLRSNFAETAFWKPHLLTGADGTAAIEFTVPDSVTSWRVFVHGVTRDLAGGMLEKEARSVKDLMVRPYLPRFFREGDRAELRVVVNNAGEKDLAGEVALEIFDPETNENLAPAFGLPAKVPAQAFEVKAGGGSAVTFTLEAPARVGTVAFKVTAKAGALSDGELRPLPVLPGRMHLVQSRFATLKGAEARAGTGTAAGAGATRELTFADLAKNDDPTRINDQLVVTVDAQLFYGLLEALPYLVNYPYECTEQTLNRFLSTGILTSLYGKYPAVARMAQSLSKRETPYETFDQTDPNRKMALEETPWLIEARGGRDAGYGVEKVLDPRVAAVQREASLAKLLKAQTSLGAFPWWPGGPPSPYMTLYIVHGFSKALEFGVAVPKDPVVQAFGYLHRHYLDEVVRNLMASDTGWEFVTFLNYTLSNFPDATWTGGVFTKDERGTMLGFSFKHWKEHSPYLKGFLALALKRAGRAKDAELVWASVMDSAKTTPDEGTSWAPEDRGWLWYNDTIETHAFALRTLMEIAPADARSEGLVEWLFLNKKLNHWKSTRATAEVIYSVAYFLRQAGALGAREAVTVETCGGAGRTTFTFEPDTYTGKKNQVVVPGDKVGPACATVRISKEGKGMAFASATWHFSTERMPEKGEGDLFAVERSYFKREKRGGEAVLKPLAEGAELAVGDEIEVHLSIRARHPAEYVHLRDPRPSGCEPVTLTSGYKWDLGLARYEEIRDSGTNFFMEWMPQGEYTLVHRMRCAMAGTFKAAPATLQSMYAPEFAAYSAGALVTIKQ